MDITIISFSGRANGNCGSVSRRIAEEFKNDSVKYLSFSSVSITPCGRCNMECFIASDNCPYITDDEFRLMDTICSSDLVFYILPNYSGQPCANFFIFNERQLSYLFGHEDRESAYSNVKKKFIVINGDESGNFAHAFNYHSTGKPQILYLSTHTYGKSSRGGDLMTSPEAVSELLKFICE